MCRQNGVQAATGRHALHRLVIPMLNRVLTLALAAALSSVPLLAQDRPAADVLARVVQQRYQGIRDFSAAFVHTYRGGVL